MYQIVQKRITAIAPNMHDTASMGVGDCDVPGDCDVSDDGVYGVSTSVNNGPLFSRRSRTH